MTPVLAVSGGWYAVVKSSAGAAANIRAVEAGQFESALVPAIMLDLAFRGRQPFKGEKALQRPARRRFRLPGKRLRRGEPGCAYLAI